jgi:hypothetical protein
VSADRRGQHCASEERLRLHPDQRESTWEPSQGPGQLDHLADAEGVGADGVPVPRERGRADEPDMRAAGRTAPLRGVYDDDLVVVSKMLEQSERLVQHDDLYAGEAELRHAGRHLGPGSVVAPPPVPDTDDEACHALTPPPR